MPCTRCLSEYALPACLELVHPKQDVRLDCVLLAPPPPGDGKQLAGAMDKMKNMAVKRDSMRKSFIEDKATAKAMAPVPNEEDAEEDDLSSYL